MPYKKRKVDGQQQAQVLQKFITEFSDHDPEIRKDIATLKLQAQAELIVALLKLLRGKRNSLPQRKYELDMIFACDDYFRTQEFAYFAWRLNNRNAPLGTFLFTTPPLILPCKQRKPPKEDTGLIHLFPAVHFYDLAQKNLKRVKRSYLNPISRKRDIERALRDTFGSINWVPPEQLRRWGAASQYPRRKFSGSVIALEATALRVGIKSSTLKRNLPTLRIFSKTIKDNAALLRDDLHKSLSCLEDAWNGDFFYNSLRRSWSLPSTP